MNTIFDSETFKKWYEGKGFKSLTEMEANKVEEYRKGGIDLNGKDKLKAKKEILADFVGEMLFGGKNQISDNLFSELDDNHKKTFREWIGALIDRLKTLFKGNKTAEDEITKLEAKFKEMLKKSVEGYSKEDGNKEDGLKYSFRGVADDGKKIYESNFPKGTPKAAKSQRILDFIKNVWSKEPINLVISNGERSRTIYARFDPTIDESQNTPTDASKIAGGNRHGNHTEQRVTLDLADDYYEIASDARYNYSKIETGKDSDTHTDVKMWHYFINDIYFAEYGEEELTPYTVTINVKEKDIGEFVYSFNAEKESSTQRTLHAAVNTYKGANGELFLDDIITHSKENVKSEFLDKEHHSGFSFSYTPADEQELTRMAQNGEISAEEYGRRMLDMKERKSGMIGHPTMFAPLTDNRFAI